MKPGDSSSYSFSAATRFRSFVEQKNPRFFSQVTFLLLSAAALLYSAVVRTRLLLYKWKILKTRTLPVPVISVGNLTLGGSGKTPVVEMLARDAIRHGKKTAVLLRGYSRKKNSNRPEEVFIDRERPWRELAEKWGDEALLLKRRLPGVHILVGKNRYEAGRKAIREFGAELIFLDDGFQHIQLNRDMNLLAVDSRSGFSNGKMFPRGFLREPLSGIARADTIVLTQYEREVSKKIKNDLKRWNPGAESVFCETKPECLVDILSGEKKPLDILKEKPVFLFSGIGRPESFERTARSLKMKVRGTARFADHHYFSLEEMKALKRHAIEKGVSAVVTTEKDALRLPSGFGFETVPAYFLKISIVSPELKNKVFLYY